MITLTNIQRSSQNGKTNKPQKKEQENSPEVDEMESSNLSDREFRVMITRIYDSMKKDIETVIKNQAEINNAISEINNTLKLNKQ